MDGGGIMLLYGFVVARKGLAGWRYDRISGGPLQTDFWFIGFRTDNIEGWCRHIKNVRPETPFDEGVSWFSRHGYGILFS